MEGIDLAGVVDSDFQGIQINFAPPHPAGFAKTCFFAGRGSPFSAGRGGAHIPGSNALGPTGPLDFYLPIKNYLASGIRSTNWKWIYQTMQNHIIDCRM